MMKKLSYNEVLSKFISYLPDRHKEENEQSEVAKSFIKAIVDSINECIEDSYAGKTVVVYQEKIILHSLINRERFEFDRDDEFKCINDRNGELKCMNKENTFYIPKEWMALK